MVAITATQPLRLVGASRTGQLAQAAPAAARFVKSAMDRVGALVILLVLLPVLLVVAAAVATDGGPVLFRQTRVGRGGRTFSILKFRSMRVDAEAVKHRLAAANEASGPLFKMRHDPRVTRVGAVLRRYSVDELPQLFNVVTGSMSLIGPRPHLPAEIAHYSADARRRLAVKPGLTGLSQISGRSDLGWDESVRLDLRYVDDWSLVLDATIALRTVRAVVSGRGAY